MISIDRLESPSDRTNGVLTLPDGSEHKTLERPWKDNKVGQSCIPKGFYFFMVDNVGRFQWFKILNVLDRKHIEFHLGTKPSHSKGCILMTIEGLRAMQKFCNDPTLKYVLEIR